MLRISHVYFYIFIVLLFLMIRGNANAQKMERKRVTQDRPVEDIFFAPKVIGLNTVKNLEKKTLHSMIMHSFGPINNGGQEFFGLDSYANIRLSLDYGITDRLSVGIARQRLDKVVDLHYKYNLLDQKRDGSIPVSVALAGNAGVTTEDYNLGFDFVNRLSYFNQIMIARKFSDRFSAQVSPVYTHFNTVFDNELNDHLGVSLAGRLKLTDRSYFTFEYTPIFTEKGPEQEAPISFGFDIITGGHVFQLFFTTSQGLNESYVLGRNTDDFWAGDIRFGFNVNRVFFLGDSSR